MPNNFRVFVDNAIYVSKEGSDSNTGFSAEVPKLTIQGGLNAITSTYKTLIIGSGYYRESVSYAGANLSLVIGDGIVIIDGDGVYGFLLATSSVKNIALKNFNCGFSSPNFVNTALTIKGAYLYIGSLLCTNMNAFGSQGNAWERCIFVNAIGNPNASHQTSIYKSILINSTLLFPVVIASTPYLLFKSNYVDQNSIVSFVSSYSPYPYLLSNNNIQGKIAMFFNGAVSGVNSNGVAQTFAQHRIDYPTFNTYSFSSDPKFNDPLNLNFTLQSDSPHIKAADDYTNIGGTEYAVYKSSTSTELTSGATISGLTLRGNNSYTITSSPTAGTLETAPIFLQWPATKPLTKLEWAGALEFNKSITAGTLGNNNVPDWDTYTTGAGANPDRLTVKMRFSTQQTIPTLSSHWDNGGYWTAGNYELFEVNAKPKVDSNGKGNGDPAYIESSGLGDIVPTWIQINVKLIDTYNP